MTYPFPGVPGYGLNQLNPDYPGTWYTPDSTTAAVTPGGAYQPLPGPGGEIRGKFSGHLGDDGFMALSPLGDYRTFFDGNQLWNQGGVSNEVSKLLNNSNFLVNQASQAVQYNYGLSPYPPNYAFPYNYPTFPGTPQNPFDNGAGAGLYGAYGYGGIPQVQQQPGANNAAPFNSNTNQAPPPSQNGNGAEAVPPPPAVPQTAG